MVSLVKGRPGHRRTQIELKGRHANIPLDAPSTICSNMMGQMGGTVRVLRFGGDRCVLLGTLTGVWDMFSLSQKISRIPAIYTKSAPPPVPARGQLCSKAGPA